jgi:hypothetical protein
MDPVFKESVRAGNRWAAEVMPLLDQPRAKEIALLFPVEMSLYEPLEVDSGGRHRMDLLGWYAQFVDLGWHVDIVHPEQVAAGALADYAHLVVPHNSLYDLGDNAALEAAVQTFVSRGGTLFHGPGCVLARRTFGIHEELTDFDCIDWAEAIIPNGWSTVAFTSGAPVATYIRSQRTAIARTSIGDGRVYSFGFEYGYAYSRRTMPIVPPEYGKREMHPLVLLARTPIAAIVGECPSVPLQPIKGVEVARFGKHVILVNHRSGPVDIRRMDAARVVPQVPGAEGWLAAHSAAYLKVR